MYVYIATEASEAVKLHKRHFKQGDDSFSDDQGITFLNHYLKFLMIQLCEKSE